MNIQRLRVPAGFAYAALFLYFSRPAPQAYLAGTSMALLGLLIRIWAAGHLDKWKQLAVSGPYRYTRNPLYFGSFLIGLGFTLSGAAIWLAALYLALFFAFYYPVMKREEEELEDAYGNDFKDYQRRVPLFLPYRGAGLPSGAQSFSWQRVRANREYNAVIGCLIFAVIVFIKM